MHHLKELKTWVKEQRDTGHEFPIYGQVSFHVYTRELTGGGVEFNLRYGSGLEEADVKIEERRPNVFTVAVVQNGGTSIDYTTKREYSMTDEIQLLLEDFPNGRNINDIVDELLGGN